MPKQNLSEFQSVVKNFKSLFAPNGLKKATIEDLGLLREALVLGTEELNKLVSTLSTISVDTGNRQQRVSNRSNTVIPSTVITEPQELGMVTAITGLDTMAVGLYDAEAEARQSNELYMNSLPKDSDLPDEVEVLEEMFASIQDGV